MARKVVLCILRTLKVDELIGPMRYLIIVKITELLNMLRTSKEVIVILLLISIITFVGTLLTIPWLIIRLPADYFANRKRRAASWLYAHPLLRPILIVVKNIFGILFIISGILMLVLPGQGILTILIGMTLLDFPGKFRFERWLVSRPLVWKSINQLRRKAGRQDLILNGDG